MVIQTTSSREEDRLLHLLESKRVFSRPMEPVFISKIYVYFIFHDLQLITDLR